MYISGTQRLQWSRLTMPAELRTKLLNIDRTFLLSFLKGNNMMNDLIKKYKHKIIPGEKSIEELIDYLKHKTDIVEIAATELVFCQDIGQVKSRNIPSLLF
ncbi:hypothetical protein [Desulfotomaculum sp. 1211_IL3151]|uniref:hypothetical protein n=1 Tax=Desulfotomaculum sp. 1211_IL3151 TaxID=3084055 RepID=UPI002FDB6AED